MTQEKLCKGICSVSYLSKIENDKAEASIDTINHLLQRLGINLDDEHNHSDLDITMELINEWYSTMREGPSNKVNLQYTILKEKIESIESVTVAPDLLLTFQLYEMHFFIINKKWVEAEKSLERLSNMEDCLTPEQYYYYQKFTGLYYYYINKHSQSIAHYKEAGSRMRKIMLSSLEQADFFYISAVTYLHIHQLPESSQHAHKALQIYDENYVLKRSAECHILIGINKRRTKHFTEAELHFMHALKISESLHDNQLVGQVHHNLGYMYSSLSQYDKAIHFYLNSLQLKEPYQIRSRLITLFSITKEYYRQRELKEGLDWVSKGKKLSTEHGMKEYIYHFRIMEYLMTNLDQNYEHLIKDEALPFYKNCEKWEYVAAYSASLGEYYESNFKYKAAVQYYKMANEAKDKMINI
jgi:tetratricopeptide (TPR) repeat protein